MVDLNGRQIAKKLAQAGRLKAIPLCIYGSEVLPNNAISSKEINRCIAHSIFSLTTDKEINAIYIENDEEKSCCPGGQAWLGFKGFMPMLKYFLSTGIASFRNGAAEYLISNPDLAEKRLSSVGKIKPLGKYIVIQKSDNISEDGLVVSAFLCFGNSVQIRNLTSLFYFRSEKSFDVQFPWGPLCASFVSYPTNMAENSPKNRVILGPTDPTGNYWFPQNYLSMGIPYEIAKRMANDLDSSFIQKRSKIAFPEKLQ
ncbi:DUF169 domain-containing protein [Thermodesulfobacteriota bacterium]